MHGRKVNRVQFEVLFAIEAFVSPLRVVDDMEREVPVVPVTSILAAYLFPSTSASGRARRGRTRSRQGGR